MPGKETLRWTSWVLAALLLGLVGGLFADQAFAQDQSWQLGVPVPLDSGGSFQVIQSLIGDFDCFGYGAPTHPVLSNSPCGTLPGLPIQDVNDDPQTDVVLACPGPTTITFTHSFPPPPTGAVILGALWTMNVGGIEKTKFTTTVNLDNVLPFVLPQTGALGTVVVSVPIFGPVAASLYDGQFVVTITRGIGGLFPKCDDIFVDFSHLALLVQLPAP